MVGEDRRRRRRGGELMNLETPVKFRPTPRSQSTHPFLKNKKFKTCVFIVPYSRLMALCILHASALICSI